MNNILFCTDSIYNKVSIDTSLLHIESIDKLIANNSNFYYLINLEFNFNNITNKFLFKDITLNLNILKQLYNKKCVIILDNSFEGTTKSDLFFSNFINNFIKKYNLNYKNFKILTGNLYEEPISKNINCEFIPYCRFYDTPHFINKYDNNQLDTLININKSKTTFDKKILCYNRVARSHRKFLFYKIYNNNLVHANINISLQNDCTYFDYKTQYQISDIENTNINDFFFEHNYDWKVDDKEIKNNTETLQLDIPNIKSHFLYLVTESLVTSDVLFLSEKTFKPIYACQPFIILGNPNILKKLKEMGFKTFDKWWDESYDSQLNITKRTDMIIKLLELISIKTNTELIEMLNDMESILIHNHKVFMEIKEPTFVEYLRLTPYTKLL